jgi:hypothetical protein
MYYVWMLGYISNLSRSLDETGTQEFKLFRGEDLFDRYVVNRATEIRTIEEIMSQSTVTVPANSPGPFSPDTRKEVPPNCNPFDFSDEKELEGDSIETKKEE